MLNSSWFGGSFGDDHSSGTLFRDVLLLAISGLMLSLIILVFHIHPPKENDAEKERSRGNIRVEIIWPQELNVDIDLWSKAPGDAPVGYSNLTGLVFNLVRDDLGNYADLSEMNYEVSFTRGIPPGEYIINLHWFSNSHGATQVPVKVLITMKKNDDGGGKESPIQVLSKSVVLNHVAEEITVIRFRLDENRDLVRDSFSTLFEKLSTFDANGN